MKKYYYDFHVHSCLSPCADDDMTPNNIAGMAVLAGLEVVALTDHNSAKNCPAFFAAAKKNGIIPIAGMELTTAEDIHVVCLFPELDGAMAFDAYVDSCRMKVPNRVDIFGEQLILNGDDETIGREEFFLPAASEITVDEAPGAVARYGGICFPAHIDREANGIIATLGTFPDNGAFLNAEFYDHAKEAEYLEKYPVLGSVRRLVSSDAHNLWSIRDKSAFLEIDDEPYSSDRVRKQIFKLLGEKI